MGQAPWRLLRYRVPLVVVLVFVALGAVQWYGMRTALVGNYTALERRTLTEDVDRACAALEAREEALGVAAADWAPWDDTYAFMDGYAKEYVEANLSTATLENLGLDFMVFVDAGGRTGYTALAGRMTATPELRRATEALAARIPTGTTGGTLGDKVLLPEGPAILAAAPITTSDRRGRPRGVLVVGRVLGGEDVEALERITMLDVMIRPPDARRIAPEDVREVRIEANDEHTIAGQRTLTGTDGTPVLRVVVTKSREAFLGAVEIMRVEGWVFVALILLSGVGMYAILDTMVLHRLTHLHRQLGSIGVDPDSPRRVEVRGSDEIAEVGVALNSTLQRLGAAEQALRHTADRDYLTDLANRRGFERQARRELAEREREGGSCALLLLDLDDFKAVNDTYGHLCGDAVLVQFSQILLESMRAYSTVARIGGDEFAVLLPHTGRDEALVALERFTQALASESWRFVDPGLRVSACVGLAVSPEDGSTLDGLFAAADVTLYANKALK